MYTGRLAGRKGIGADMEEEHLECWGTDGRAMVEGKLPSHVAKVDLHKNTGRVVSCQGRGTDGEVEDAVLRTNAGLRLRLP